MFFVFDAGIPPFTAIGSCISLRTLAQGLEKRFENNKKEIKTELDVKLL